MPLVSVILATFEQPNALAFALLGYARQSFRDFELVVADDGSGPETKEVVEEARRRGAFPLKHVWQENKGFRRARITNEGARAAEGRILLVSDGDCVPHRDFVKAHAEACAPGAFCAGGYVRLDAERSLALTRENVAAGAYEAACTPAELRRFRWTHWRNRWALLFGHPRKPKVYGCNLSVDRSAFEAVNGFDENFDGFGKEDSDLRNRLRASGARPVSLWGKAWVYHVEDVVDPRCRERRIPRGDPYPYYGRPDVPFRCANGLVKAP
jgi:glycosyltransferase involved in cell wall biosynthesis